MTTEPLSIFEHEARRVVTQLQIEKTSVILADDGSPAAYLVEPQTYHAALDRLHMLEAIALGERDIAQGRTLTHAQVKEKMARWLK